MENTRSEFGTVNQENKKIVSGILQYYWDH
jgi:hypothetical protein